MNAFGKFTTIVQQLDGEITEGDYISLSDELTAIGKEYSGDPEMTTLVNMMLSLTNYIKARLGKIHAETLPILESIAETASSLANQPDMAPQERQDMVKNKMEQFRQFQNKLASNPPVQPSEIENLKAVLLAIDWEISDETLQNFDAEITRQLELFKDYNIHHMFLKMLHTTGRYVAAQKAKAHADSIFFLRSVFNSFEKLIQSPDMPLKEKKQLLETELKKFNDFKSKIAKPPESQKPPETAPETVEDTIEDESLPPALSHLKGSSPPDEGDEADGLLTSLDEDAAPAGQPEPLLQAAPEAPSPAPNESQDVMGDLFSIKESPADELLDAIHLMDVHGSSPDKAMSMLDAAEAGQSDGMKKFTAERIDKQPIPEIDSRLDEFFNLEPASPAPEMPPASPPEPETVPMADLSASDDDESEIIPFDAADESQDFQVPPVEEQEDDTVKVLERLKASFQNEASLSEAASNDALRSDIAALKNVWQLDPEKRLLMEIIEASADLIGARRIEDNKDTPADEIPSADEVTPADEPAEKKGIWQKLKSIFSS